MVDDIMSKEAWLRAHCSCCGNKLANEDKDFVWVSGGDKKTSFSITPREDIKKLCLECYRKTNITGGTDFG